MSISSALSLISFAGPDSNSGSSSRFTAMGIYRGLRTVVGGGDFSREAIILNISVKGVRLFEVRRLIEGRLLYSRKYVPVGFH